MISIVRALQAELSEWLEALIIYMPGRIGRVVRSAYMKRRLKEVGSGLVIQPGVIITGHENIRLGVNVSLNRNSILRAHSGSIEMGDNSGINSNTTVGAADNGRVIIGSDVSIAQNVVLRASDHETRSIKIPIRQQGHTGGTIVIEDGVWIAANVVITRNVRIGAHSIVAAGAVVTNDVEPYSVVGGVPATLIRKRLGTGPVPLDSYARSQENDPTAHLSNLS